MTAHQPRHAEMTSKEREDILAEFKRVVNMTPAALRKWLDSEGSRTVGMTPDGDKVTQPGGPESVGHHMGHRILELKAARPSDLSADDVTDMRKVVGYVHRHIVQRPKGDVTETRWRKSLMNWGHDPLAD